MSSKIDCRDKKMDKRKIKAMLMERGIKQKDIADNLGLKRSTISGVLNGLRTSKRIKQAVSEILHLPYEQLWGEKADE